MTLNGVITALELSMKGAVAKLRPFSKKIFSSLFSIILLVSFLYIVFAFGSSILKISIFLMSCLLLATLSSKHVVVNIFKKSSQVLKIVRIIASIIFLSLWIWFFSDYSIQSSIISGFIMLILIAEKAFKSLKNLD